MNNFEGVIIEESLVDRGVLGEVEIISQKIEKVTEKHKTPWVSQWTLDSVRIAEGKARSVAETISQSIDTSHKTPWYADYKNKTHHYIIYPNKIFYIDRSKLEEYQAATDYGISLGIPDYQVDFAPNSTTWDR